MPRPMKEGAVKAMAFFQVMVVEAFLRELEVDLV
jgi:hypothetical protein